MHPVAITIGAIIGGQVALWLPLALWRWIYPLTDWSLLAFLLLGLLLLRAAFLPAVATNRARLGIELRAGSFLNNYLTGRLNAAFSAVAFTALALPVLAWQALTVPPETLLGFLALSLSAGGIALGVEAWLLRHFSPWLACTSSITIATLLAALFFVPLLAWLNWHYVSHPAEIMRQPMLETMASSIDNLPVRRGWPAEILSVFYAFDAAKLWLTVKFGASGWITALYSLDAALSGLVIARASALLTNLIARDMRAWLGARADEGPTK